jgi:hypothetical protein
MPLMETEKTTAPPQVGCDAVFALGKAHLDELARLAMSAWSELLAAWTGRKRKLGKYAASHPKTLEALVADLDARGETEAADSIHSLVWELALQRQRDMRGMLSEIEMGIMFRAQDAVKANDQGLATQPEKHK